MQRLIGKTISKVYTKEAFCNKGRAVTMEIIECTDGTIITLFPESSEEENWDAHINVMDGSEPDVGQDLLEEGFTVESVEDPGNIWIDTEGDDPLLV